MSPEVAEGHDAGISAALFQQQVNQLLTEQGKQTTLLAVIDTKLSGVISQADDHEKRIRENTASIADLQASSRASRSLVALVLSVAAVLAAAGSVVAGFVH